MSLRVPPGRVAAADTRRVRPPPKAVDPHYRTPEHDAWRRAVMARAGWRCEAVENGRRCAKAAPEHRMFADHIVELRDGGAATDPANGQVRCGAHHTAKTVAERAARR